MAKIEVKLKKNVSENKIYEEVEYIEGTGTQWLSLDKEVDYNTTQSYCKFQLTELPSSGMKMIYLIKVINNADRLKNYAAFNFYENENLMIMTEGMTTSGYSYEWIPNYHYTTNDIIEIYHNYKDLYVNNNSSNLIKYLEGFDNGCNPTGIMGDNIGLFASERNISSYSPIKMKLFSFKYGNSMNWVSDLVPCVRKSDQVAGLYDKIKKKFYTNSGTGEFLVGSKTGTEYVDDELAIDKFNGLKSISSLSQSNPSAGEIYYGVSPNSGTINIVDNNGEIAKMIQSGELPNTNVDIKIYANDNSVQHHISSDSNYTALDKKFNVGLSNLLDEWDTLQYDGYAYKGQSETAYNMLVSVLQSFGFDTTTQIPNMLENVELELKAITLARPFLGEDTYRATIDKFCQLAQMQVYQDDNGTIRFVSARPISSTTTKIEIPLSKQLRQLNASLILKNKYDAVEITPSRLIIDNDASATTANFNGQGSYPPPSNKELTDTISNQPVNNTTLPVDAVGFYSTGTTAASRPQKTGARIEVYYLEGDIIIPKSDSEQYLDFTYNIEMGGRNYPNITWNNDTSWNDSNWATPNRISSNMLYSSANVGETSRWSGDKLYSNNMIKEFYAYFDNNGHRKTGELSLSVSPKFEKVELSNQYVIHYKIPVGWFSAYCFATYYDYQNRWEYNYQTQNVYIRQADTLTVSITSSKLSKQDSDTMKVGTGDNVYTYANNELMSITENDNIVNSVYYKNAQNILNDYRTGIVNGEIEIVCDNYYANSQLEKNWVNGEMIKVGDIVELEESSSSSQLMPSTYKVTSREFVYEGVPKIRLQLEESLLPVDYYEGYSEPAPVLREGVKNGGYVYAMPTLPMRDVPNSSSKLIHKGWKYTENGQTINLTFNQLKNLRITKPYKFVADWELANVDYA